MRLLLLTLAVLLGAACASQELPYDAPQVGVDGVAQVFGVERYEGFEDSKGRVIEVVIWRTVREDGRECDEISFKAILPAEPDAWFSLRHQLENEVASLPSTTHFSLPDAICLHADVAGVER